jgi:hypothetical protein
MVDGILRLLAAGLSLAARKLEGNLQRRQLANRPDMVEREKAQMQQAAQDREAASTATVLDPNASKAARDAEFDRIRREDG